MITKENSVKKTLQKHMLADGLDIVMDFENSKASRIVDKLTGKTYLDMFSMFASGAVGYNHPYILQHQAWLAKYATYKPTLSDIYFEEYADFLEVFSRVVIPQELQYCFFIEGGALAVENALKTAFDWKTRKNRQQGSRIQASMVIHFEQAFHGRSGYTLSLTNTSDPRKYEYFPKFNWPRIINPKLKFPISEASLATTLEQEAKALMHIQEVILANPYQVACIIIEPIQSEGGDNYFRPEFFQNLRKICDENDILLIFDEVQTGIGITGKMFAFQHISVIPDILSFGKKTQVCGILANKEKLDQVEQHVFKESSRINSTFGGNFVDMLRLKLILEIIENENLVQNAQKQGEFLLSGLIKLQESFPDYISNARGLGLVCAIDLPSTELRNEIQNQLFIEKQILILPCGEKSLRFRPHLNIQQSDLEEVLSAISAVVTKDHL